MVKQLEFEFMKDPREGEDLEALKSIFIPGYLIKTLPKDWDNGVDKTLGYVGAIMAEVGKITMYAMLAREIF